MNEPTHRAIKYRIYPAEPQKTLILKTIGSSRFVYNHMLEVSKSAYLEGKKICSRNKFNYLVNLKDTEYIQQEECEGNYCIYLYRKGTAYANIGTDKTEKRAIKELGYIAENLNLHNECHIMSKDI